MPHHTQRLFDLTFSRFNNLQSRRDFEEGGKLKSQEEKPPEQRQVPMTNSN